ncbi:MAG: hypothetical protein L6R39_005043 [Caloplaca ligustica]|nr:MAG: hypothetical protein L6R39_005043 [Caloplaca ligustica]
MERTSASNLVRTRFFIISDTHGKEFPADEEPVARADVAIHCGDLTEGSFLEEYRASLRLLKDVDAPLKLVIAGNHDFTMDPSVYEREITNARQSLGPAWKEAFGEYGEARQLFEEAKDAGIVLLDEGNHRFVLGNGALLTVYASPWTPLPEEMQRSLGGWGFQYARGEGHKFAIPKGTGVVVTHGPPEGVMDRAGKTRAGCPQLFAAVARARPRLHCFGHIHPQWGAKLVTWYPLTERPSHFADIDNKRSLVIENLSSLKGSNADMPGTEDERLRKTERCRQERCYTTSHCRGDTHPLEAEKQTLFINAATQSTDKHLSQLPWVFDVELPKAD